MSQQRASSPAPLFTHTYSGPAGPGAQSRVNGAQAHAGPAHLLESPSSNLAYPASPALWKAPTPSKMGKPKPGTDCHTLAGPGCHCPSRGPLATLAPACSTATPGSLRSRAQQMLLVTGRSCAVTVFGASSITLLLRPAVHLRAVPAMQHLCHRGTQDRIQFRTTRVVTLSQSLVCPLVK